MPTHQDLIYSIVQKIKKGEITSQRALSRESRRIRMRRVPHSEWKFAKKEAIRYYKNKKSKLIANKKNYRFFLVGLTVSLVGLSHWSLAFMTIFILCAIFSFWKITLMDIKIKGIGFIEKQILPYMFITAKPLLKF